VDSAALARLRQAAGLAVCVRSRLSSPNETVFAHQPAINADDFRENISNSVLFDRYSFVDALHPENVVAANTVESVHRICRSQSNSVESLTDMAITTAPQQASVSVD
jgi:hypothetical protein